MNQSYILVNLLGNATRHEYVRSELTTRGDDVRGIAHLWRCTETAAVRIYGFDSPADHRADGGAS